MEEACQEARIRRWSGTPRWTAEAEALLGALERRPGDELLDVGCGPGSLLRLASAGGLRAYGVDRWEGWAGRSGEPRTVRADAGRLPFADGSFTAVVFMHALAHVDPVAGALGEAFRVLRSGGRLGVATPNALFLRALALPSLVRRYRKDPTVVRHFTRRALRAAVEAAGFRVLREGPWGSPAWTMPLPAFRERLLLVAERPA